MAHIRAEASNLLELAQRGHQQADARQGSTDIQQQHAVHNKENAANEADRLGTRSIVDGLFRTDPGEATFFGHLAHASTLKAEDNLNPQGL